MYDFYDLGKLQERFVPNILSVLFSQLRETKWLHLANKNHSSSSSIKDFKKF